MDLNHTAHRPASCARLVNTAQITLDPKRVPWVWCGSIQCAHLDFAQKMRVPTVRLRGFRPMRPHATKFDVFVAQCVVVDSRQIALPNADGIRVVCAHATINTTAPSVRARTSTAHICVSPKDGVGGGCSLTLGIGGIRLKRCAIVSRATALTPFLYSIDTKKPTPKRRGSKGERTPHSSKRFK